MSSNSKLRDEMRFQQRWDFRRGDSDFDTSSSDSKYSLGVESDHKRHKAVSSSVPVDNKDETIKFQLKRSSIDPVTAGKTENGKAATAKRRNSTKRENLNVKKTGSRKIVRRKKVETNAALNDLKNHMNSLLEELQVSRKNLLSWLREEMKKLAAQEKACVSAELQHQNNLFGRNIQIPYQNNFEKHVQQQKPIKFDENVINLEEDIETQPQPKTQEKDQTAAKNGNGKVYKRSNKRKKLSPDFDNRNPELEHPIDYSGAIILSEPEEEGEIKRWALDAGKSKVEPQKRIVLGIRAPNRKDKFSAMKSASKCEKASNPKNQRQVPDFQLERSGLSFEPKLLSESLGQVASPMYLTIPSKPNLSYIQPRLVAQNSGLPNVMVGSGRHLGNFQAQMSFRDLLTNGFSGPLYPNHFNLENLHRENNRPNLTMNGGGSGSGRNYYPCNIANNFQMPSDERLVSYQDSNQFPM